MTEGSSVAARHSPAFALAGGIIPSPLRRGETSFVGGASALPWRGGHCPSLSSIVRDCLELSVKLDAPSLHVRCRFAAVSLCFPCESVAFSLPLHCWKNRGGRRKRAVRKCASGAVGRIGNP